jgi:hypothetical protein
MRQYLIPAAIVLTFGMAAPASASTVYDLDVISASNIGTGNQGTVTLTQNGADQVNIVVSLVPGVLLVNTGGPHTPFVFDLASAVSGAIVSITSTNSPSFFVATGSQQATPDGTFTNGIGYNGSNGGVGHGSAGPLDFSVTDASGITISDFIANGDGYFFAADVLGTGGNTGTVGANVALSTTPLPAALPLFAGGLGVLGLFGRRKKQKALNALAA